MKDFLDYIDLFPKKERAQFTAMPAWQAKKLGKKAPIDKVKWAKQKYEIMAHLILEKFLNSQDLKEMLLATEDAYLEETNSWGDTDWGKNEDGEGENNLGRILMEVRKFIQHKNKL